jgi:ATP-dependent protease ClpP protease subunit
VPSNPDYRENPERAVYLTGDINQELVDKLTPQIISLRQKCTTPITAYIDSRGGDIFSAEGIRNLLQTPNQDGEKCRLITVVTGTAASAAADFLTLGDYAIAYPHTQIMYHGSRRVAQVGLTVESASSLAQNLQQTNEFFATILAQRAFDRFVFRIKAFTEGFRSYTEEHQGLDTPDLKPLVNELRQKLGRDVGEAAKGAVQKQEDINSLTDSANRHLKKFGKPLAGLQLEKELFNAILEYKSQLHGNEKWLLSQGGLWEVAGDFILLHDFHFGQHNRVLDRWIALYGKFFLGATQLKAFEALPPDEKQRSAFLSQNVRVKIQVLWYFGPSGKSG